MHKNEPETRIKELEIELSNLKSGIKSTGEPSIACSKINLYRQAKKNFD